ADNVNQRIALVWQDHAYDETGSRVERRLANQSGFTTIATLGADVTSYTDTSAAPATNYVYRIIATNGGGDSLASNDAAAAIRVAPATPTGLVASVLS